MAQKLLYHAPVATPTLKFAAIPAALVSLVYAPLLFGKVIYNRDMARWIYPARWFVRDCFERGQAPWWNPDVGLGFSVFADPLYGLFYPPNLLHLAGPLPLMVMLVLLLHLLAGTSGMTLLGRQLGMRRAAAAVAGLAWALSGFVASLWTNGLRLPAAAWIPWQCLAFVRLADANLAGRPWQRAAAAAGAAVAGGMLAGDVFVAVMGTGLGLGMGLVRSLSLRRAGPGQADPLPPRVWQRMLGAAVVAVAAGIAVGMITILPGTRALGSTERGAGLPAAYAELGSLHPARLLEFAVAGGFGKAWEFSPDAPWVQAVLDGRPLSMSVYLGGSVLALLLLAWRRPSADASNGEGRRDFAVIAGLSVLAALCLLVALGRHTPVHAFVRTAIPPLGYMRSPEKYLLAFVPCMALLAGFGAQRLLLAEPGTPWRRVAALGAALLALAALAPRLPADLASFVRPGALHAALAAAAVGAALFAARSTPQWASLLLLAVVTADLGIGSSHALRYGAASLLTDVPAAARAVRADHGRDGRPAPRLFRGPTVQESATRAGGAARETLLFETLRDNFSVPFGIAILPGYDAAIPPALPALLASRRIDALRLLGVNYALLPPRPDGDNRDGLSPLADPVAGVRLYRLDRQLPRVFLGFHADVQAAAGAPARLLDEDVVNGRRILLDGGVSLDGPAADPVPCAIERYSTTLIQARCSADRPALAVFVEQHAPGWSATVDGAPASLLKADALLRAVPVPAGSHVIALAYDPPGLREGAAVALLGFGALVFLACRRPRGRGGLHGVL